jgi:hopene-associated glycosyltransferase HpnB
MCQAVLVLPAIAVTGLAALAWVYLLAGHGQFWRTDQRLPAAIGAPAAWPSVVAVVPARDEAAVLPTSLPSLLGQDYPGSLRVVLVDDQSADGTAEVAMRLSRDLVQGQPAGRPDRLTVLVGAPLPPGWAGKVWAMHQGLHAAGTADYVLFTDADIAYGRDAVLALAAAARGSGRVMISQMALLRADSGWERLLIPAFVYFFAQLYPFRRVNRPGSRTAAAAGGCMLVRREALDAVGGLEPIRSARIDDVALGRLLKRPASRGGAQAGVATWLGFSTEVVSTRSYQHLAEIWDMVARSAFTQLRYSPLMLAGTVLGMIWLYLVPVAAAVAGLVMIALGPAASGATVAQWAGLAAAGLAAWLIMAVSYLPVLRLYRLSPARAVALPAIGALYTAMTVSSARRHYAGRGGQWKGRTIQSGRVGARP